MPYSDKQIQAEYQRKWVAKRRQSWLDSCGGCAKCGSTEGLELHHKDPSAKVDHRIWSWSDSRRNEELSKCEALCRRCHQSLHKDPLRRHGLRSYQHHGCRCDICKAAKMVERKRYLAKKKLGGTDRLP